MSEETKTGFTDLKFTLALDMDFSLEECVENAKGMIDRLEEFIASGFNEEVANKLGFTIIRQC